MYDKNNVFAKIIRGEIPSKKIYEDDKVLCFEDINKVTPIHWLVIPKTEDRDFNEFVTNNHPKIISNFFQIIDKIIKQHGIEKDGFKLLNNCGKNCGQTVFHFHIHILSGKKMNPTFSM